jgi:uncharacterized phage infection (PIP) family protein YhgE
MRGSNARLNKLALEASEKNRSRLERTLDQVSTTVVNEEKKASASVQLLQISESALVRLNEQLRDEVDGYRRELDSERQHLEQKETAYQQLKQDYVQIKRRLGAFSPWLLGSILSVDKRETMISMALSKLEVRLFPVTFA